MLLWLVLESWKTILLLSKSIIRVNVDLVRAQVFHASYPFDRIKRLYDINVHGAFFTAREAARHMIPQGGGSIILIASMSANIVNIPQVCISLRSISHIY